MLDHTFPFKPHKTETHHSLTLPAGVTIPFIPKNAVCIVVQAITQNIRFTLDGVTPTATVGFQLVASATPIRIDLNERITFKCAYESSGAILQYEIGE